MTIISKRLICVFVLAILTLLLTNTAVSQENCPEGVSCPTIRLPDGFTGDFFFGDTVLAAGQNAPVLQIPPGRQQVIVRNIISSDPNFNVLFVYQEAAVDINLRAGQARTFNVRVREQFIRGTLNFTCTIANQRAGENVACAVSVDGVYKMDVAVGQRADFILDPGERLVQVQVVGENAALWASAVWQQPTNIVAGRTARSRSQFAKLGHIIVSLNQPGAVGDFYVNGELVASQVASVDRWLPPGSYTVDARNITDPAGAGVYRWLDASLGANARSGQERLVNLRLKKELLPTPVPPVGGCDCASGDTLNCTNFSLQSEAQQCFTSCMASTGQDVHDFDGDSDGVACESLP